MGRGLAEQLGVIGLSRADIGIDVTGYIPLIDDPKICLGYEDCKGQGNCGNSEDNRKCRRKKLPAGHRYFFDCVREQNARRIAWMMRIQNHESWFVTLTFRNFIHVNRARQLLKRWIYSMTIAYGHVVSDIQINGSCGLKWVYAQEWQKRHVIHFHIIISGVRLDSLSRIRWENRWSAMKCENNAGGYLFPCGFARIYKAEHKAAPYLAKYVGKTDDPGNALEWGGSWQGNTVPDSLRCCRA